MIELKGRENKDCKIFIDDVEQSAYSTIFHILDAKAFKDKAIRIMPDVHDGCDIVIGFTSELGDSVNPNHVGVDIGCGVSSIRVKSGLKLDLSTINEKIIKSIPMGMNYNSESVYKELNYMEIEKLICHFIKKWNNLYNDNKKLISINEDYIANLIKKVNISSSTFYNSIGTLGGGNHFIEVGVDNDNRYWITVHSGSRNFGLKVCKYHSDRAKSQIGDSNSYLTKDLMFDYCIDMVIAQYYADLNRKTILNKIVSILNIQIDENINSIHNYIDSDNFIIRKGATSAQAGEKCIIPFNMRDGILICEGKGNKDWNYSAPHGAGRILII